MPTLIKLRLWVYCFPCSGSCTWYTYTWTNPTVKVIVSKNLEIPSMMSPPCNSAWSAKLPRIMLVIKAFKESASDSSTEHLNGLCCSNQIILVVGVDIVDPNTVVSTLFWLLLLLLVMEEQPFCCCWGGARSVVVCWELTTVAKSWVGGAMDSIVRSWFDLADNQCYLAYKHLLTDNTRIKIA